MVDANYPDHQASVMKYLDEQIALEAELDEIKAKQLQLKEQEEVARNRWRVANKEARRFLQYGLQRQQITSKFTYRGRLYIYRDTNSGDTLEAEPLPFALDAQNALRGSNSDVPTGEVAQGQLCDRPHEGDGP